MKIALIGYGRMGREIERMAPTLESEICARFDLGEELSPSSDLKGAHALIDFSGAQAIAQNLTTAALLNIPIVEGTTGWYEQLEQIKEIPGLTMIYSANFSMGVYRFQQVTQFAGQLFGAAGGYDAYVHEWHHAGKADSPSGTALSLAKTLLAEMPQKTELLTNTSNGKIAPQALHVTSTRTGRIPGTHEIGFDSIYDQITLRHQAFGREAFAYGALRAAEWILDRTGIYTMADFMSKQK